MINLEWNIDKNEQLKKQRGVCFEDVECAILDDKMVGIKPHFNPEKYPNQKILIVELNAYIYYVPFVLDDEKLFLKSIIPSRKLNKMYNRKD